MNLSIIIIAFVFLILVALVWLGGNIDAQLSMREWLEDHWKIIVAVIFIVLVIIGLFFS